MHILCENVALISIGGYAISFLAWFGILKYLESALARILVFVLSILDPTAPKVISNAISLIFGSAQYLLLFTLVPMGFGWVVFFSDYLDYLNPLYLIRKPQYALYATSITLMVVLSYVFSKIIKRKLNSKEYRNPNSAILVNICKWIYFGAFLTISAPYIAYTYFDYLLPTGSVFYWFVPALLQYFQYAFFMVTSSALPRAMLASLWLAPVIPYYVLHGLSRHPSGAIGTIGFLVGSIAMAADYFEICGGLS